MNGLSLIALIALAIGVVVAYRAGVRQGRRAASAATSPFSALASPTEPPRPARVLEPARTPLPPPAPTAAPSSMPASLSTAEPLLDAERARCLRAAERENAALRRALAGGEAERLHLRALADERRALFVTLADARAETARYRTILVDLENDAPPPLLDGPRSPDDLKLIVGVGPVLERMLQQLGVTTYRQIAHWSEHDIDTFDARLSEFPGRIRRDTWVTQARALHQSKYGTRP